MIASGTPEDVARTEGSYTGQYLKELLARTGSSPDGKRNGWCGRLVAPINLFYISCYMWLEVYERITSNG